MLRRSHTPTMCACINASSRHAPQTRMHACASLLRFFIPTPNKLLSGASAALGVSGGQLFGGSAGGGSENWARSPKDKWPDSTSQSSEMPLAPFDAAEPTLRRGASNIRAAESTGAGATVCSPSQNSVTLTPANLSATPASDFAHTFSPTPQTQNAHTRVRRGPIEEGPAHHGTVGDLGRARPLCHPSTISAKAWQHRRGRGDQRMCGKLTGAPSTTARA